MNAALAVIVIGRNEGERLGRCLASVRGMRAPAGGMQVFYVDSGSTDGSPERASALGAAVIRLEDGGFTAARARNAGWRAASAPLVLFLDGDTVLHPDFVEQAIARLADPEVAVVWGERRELHPEASLYNRVLDLDWIATPGPSDYCGGDALMRRAVLESAGGYDEALIAGEEPDLCRRMRALGYVILHIAAPMTGHDLALRHFGQYWRRAVRTGHAYREVSERYRGTVLPLWEVEAWANLLRGAFWMALAAGSALASAWLWSPWPLGGAVAFLLLMAARTGRRFAWKGGSRWTRFLYGLHSHVQQVPIFFGQLGYWRDRRAGTRRRLIEYKERHV